MSVENKKFNEMLSKFCERGFLKEVYSSEKAIVCNAYNQFYIAFSTDLLKEYDAGFPGFIMNSHGLKSILNDENFVNYYYGCLSDEDQDHTLVFLNEELFRFWMERDSEFKQKVPADNMDMEFEEYLLENGAEAALEKLLEGEPRRRSFFDFFRRK